MNNLRLRKKRGRKLNLEFIAHTEGLLFWLQKLTWHDPNNEKLLEIREGLKRNWEELASWMYKNEDYFYCRHFTKDYQKERKEKEGKK